MLVVELLRVLAARVRGCGLCTRSFSDMRTWKRPPRKKHQHAVSTSEHSKYLDRLGILVRHTIHTCTHDTAATKLLGVRLTIYCTVLYNSRGCPSPSKTRLVIRSLFLPMLDQRCFHVHAAFTHPEGPQHHSNFANRAYTAGTRKMSCTADGTCVFCSGLQVVFPSPHSSYSSAWYRIGQDRTVHQRPARGPGGQVTNISSTRWTPVNPCGTKTEIFGRPLTPRPRG